MKRALQHLALLACFAYIGCILAACGGGEPTPDYVCLIDGKPHPANDCAIAAAGGGR